MKRIRIVPKVIQLKNKQRWDDSLKILEISDVDAAYIAGFVDGEGCITLYKVDTSPSGYTKHTAAT